MARCCFILCSVLYLLLASCSQKPERIPAIGEAFVAPISINIKRDLATNATVVGTANQGEKLEILQTRRIFTRVRTGKGIEGWVEAKQLLSVEQIQELRRISDQSSVLPSQGAASVSKLLNVHTAPNINAPSTHQLPENAIVEVIGHRLAARIPYRPPTPPVTPKPVVPKRKPKTKEKEKEKVRSALAPPPVPPAPGLPPNWLALSASPFAKAKVEKQIKEPPPPPKFDDWSLIRTKDGKAGWVLTTRLMMLIPDEVAQYADGRRIMSYFKLGDAKNADSQKFHWLWTTIGKGPLNYEFDQIRVFIFNTRRNRYETAYIERNVTGYYPVTQMQVEVSNRKEKYMVPGFSCIIEDKDGQLVKKTYAFEGYRVRLIQKEPWKRLAETDMAKPLGDLIPSNGPAPEPAVVPQSWWEKTKQKLNIFSSKNKAN